MSRTNDNKKSSAAGTKVTVSNVSWSYNSWLSCFYIPSLIFFLILISLTLPSFHWLCQQIQRQECWCAVRQVPAHAPGWEQLEGGGAGRGSSNVLFLKNASFAKQRECDLVKRHTWGALFLRWKGWEVRSWKGSVWGKHTMGHKELKYFNSWERCKCLTPWSWTWCVLLQYLSVVSVSLETEIPLNSWLPSQSRAIILVHIREWSTWARKGNRFSSSRIKTGVGRKDQLRHQALMNER